MYSFYRHQIVGRKLNNAIKIDFGVILHLWVNLMKNNLILTRIIQANNK